ncbi:MAG: M15 family metallopeptidase [Butyrivibrio sp.]|nr:M15 family metallopeptidase [Butyrivibrio sp.]
MSTGNSSSERVTYTDGFYYEPISNEVYNRIAGISYPIDCPVPIDELRYVSICYVDFKGETQTGELICNKALAQDLVEIFSELYKNDYQLESVKLVDEFGGDDDASMKANNTSCFNYRTIPGSTRISNHAKGRAIDINPFYNPYITYKKDGSMNISPVGSEPYADRSASFPYKIDENDLAYKLFTSHGFSWGGHWNSSKDYQHFEKKGE